MTKYLRVCDLNPTFYDSIYFPSQAIDISIFFVPNIYIWDSTHNIIVIRSQEYSGKILKYKQKIEYLGKI